MVDKKYTVYLEQFVTEKRKALFKKVLNERTRHFTVAIEDIFQPHNASAMVRTCDIFGVQDMHVIESKYKFYASRLVAKGAQKWVDFSMYNQKDTNNTLNCIAALREKGYKIIATTPHNESCLLQDFDITQKSAFFFGVEKEGLSKDVMDNADGFLKIPMVGFTESLNISVAAAIILQNMNEKLKASTVNWQLSELEKSEKYQDWLEKTIKSIIKIKENYYAEN
ncbi:MULTISPECIES: TrmH family RNA methyltransferase [Flavobacteriaceae]|uniref:tRNA (guanosine(18)-2'-O)-methyltransferase n=2 Tax=Flavobacteriaceae TaxID=49546 RepID=A0A4Y8AVN9_9FLAO|nr:MULTISPECIES: RNA methyltransferase [Flavobacteriaceae]TEW76603.1 TrmH family RNA methyltransferase [Gramella jeungdoensis]GGK51579.1 tRNA (guanosine(18)-2'-O)-methyltransferase [Lutibacter litoralis]